MQPRLVVPMIFAVLAIWLVGTWVTKFSLGEMAIYTPIAVLAVGAFAGIVLLWVKIVAESMRRRREPEA
ncbi:MAG: hypothetical protein H0V45_09560 [Actinobacteria bacterium]|nr:hypothetical protein [Actinomycetota bacterium]